MKIGIVLGGGFARGACQSGFLKAIMKYIKREDISLISGSSIGGLNALTLANNTVEYAEQVYKTQNFSSFKNLKINLKNKVIYTIIEDFIAKSDYISIPMYITGTCLNSLSTHYFYIDNSIDRNELKEIVNVTMTFPFVNGVFHKYRKKFYLDGGALDNIPVYPFLVKPVDFLLILHNYPKYLPPYEIVEKIPLVVDIDVGTRCGNNIKTYSFERNNITKMYDIAYDYGLEFANKVLVNLNDFEKLKESAQKFIRDEIELRKKNKVTVTAAVFFNKLQQSRGLK